MGLLVSYGCWTGSYSTFHTWRRQLASLVGIDLEQMQGFGGTRPWTDLEPDILHVLLAHDDNGGPIAARHCGPLADRLADFVSRLPPDRPYPDDGTVPDDPPLPDARARTQRFVAGLRRASRRRAAGEFF